MGSTIIHTSMNRIIRLAACCVLALSMQVHVMAQQAAPRSMKIYPELEGHWFLDGKLRFGCEVTYTNGGKRRTAGYLQGNLLWSEFRCSSEQAIFDRDLCMVDLSAVARNGSKLEIHATMVDNPQIKTTFILKVPPINQIRVSLSESERIRYGRTIEPLVTVDYNNGLSYSFHLGAADALIHADSVELYFNKEKIPPGAHRLPAYAPDIDRSFTLSVVWKSRPWLNDLATFVYDGRDDVTVRLAGKPGLNGGFQSKAPQGMEGVEGFYGMRGGDGPPIEIFLRYDSRKEKLSIDITAAGKRTYKLLDPREASIRLIARGGRGGKGGRGGDGGDASMMDPYAAGVGGNGGVGGSGGKGSKIVIHCARNAERFLPCLLIDNSGGEGGLGGKGGRGGKFSTGYGAPTILDLLFPSRNYPGNQGAMGSMGEPGEEPEIILMD